MNDEEMWHVHAGGTSGALVVGVTTSLGGEIDNLCGARVHSACTRNDLIDGPLAANVVGNSSIIGKGICSAGGGKSHSLGSGEVLTGGENRVGSTEFWVTVAQECDRVASFSIVVVVGKIDNKCGIADSGHGRDAAMSKSEEKKVRRRRRRGM